MSSLHRSVEVEVIHVQARVSCDVLSKWKGENRARDLCATEVIVIDEAAMREICDCVSRGHVQSAEAAWQHRKRSRRKVINRQIPALNQLTGTQENGSRRTDN